ncbi:ribonuclease H-like domain-containing protein [Clostridium pasteurianum]|uniref:YprB ribonuclease H-like domain-containing protein n=1 Tax=Clostridium pasteurianum BC1 TaxID=86416 RepID=R4K4X1_CLOPA|nr:ribonuclease H-like domain-containing protein [Clostridium pasteurianum]AGK98212.1 hypothetical protein Clopa_3418 [Clostridium pasteurianum BC1]
MVIIKNNIIKVEKIHNSLALSIEYNDTLYKNALFFDLEHYVYKKPICIGLKNLEKIFEIERESAVISGSNLAKTISKIIKDKDYFSRIPEEKKDKILLYNQQDMVSLFYILTNWKKYV